MLPACGHAHLYAQNPLEIYQLTGCIKTQTTQRLFLTNAKMSVDDSGTHDETSLVGNNAMWFSVCV